MSADLPGLPGVPAEVGPVACPGCGQCTATVGHHPLGDGTYTATLLCSGCGECRDLWMEAYTTGLTVGVLVEAARRGDPRVARLPEAARPEWLYGHGCCGRWTPQEGCPQHTGRPAMPLQARGLSPADPPETT